VRQRLYGAAPLEAVVLDLLQDLPASFWPNPCKRVRDWQESGEPVSGNTASYSKARQKLPLPVVEQSCDRIFDQLMARMGAGKSVSRRGFLVDGTSMRLAASPALAKRFPPATNQHGESHWPVVRAVVAHDLETGLAMRPQWEAMYGPDASSEQRLLEAAIDRLPQGATVVADCNFGVFFRRLGGDPKGISGFAAHDYCTRPTFGRGSLARRNGPPSGVEAQRGRSQGPS
jgi:hypothetical protein